MKGSDLVAALMKKFKASSGQALARRLGITGTNLHNWTHNRPKVTARQVASLVHKARTAGEADIQVRAIRPLVEFFPIERSDSKQGAKYELFGVEADGERHPYLEGLRTELAQTHGVYIFFDSRGQAIYVGKARVLNLWEEMKGAFNRERGAIQKIRRVKHPLGQKREYRTSDEKARQIVEHVVPLHELAKYFSAYDVVDGMINELEAMLVRSFANDLLNKRMERFGHQKNKKPSGRARRHRRRLGRTTGGR
jgi:DNA-binding transcriptional regulator YdaS (Cro superfamily)